MPKIVDEVGNRYGRLKVVACAGRNKHRKVLWECICDCSNVVTVIGSSLRYGYTSSCGCENVLCTPTHGMRNHPAYNSYHRAKQRCSNKLDPAYSSYGGRGIQFKFTSFEQFWEELGPTWREGLSIDRKNNDGHYEPENCRWATMKEQNNNKRSSVKIFRVGERITLYQAAAILNVSYESAKRLYHKFGQSLEDWTI
jgi:hypothetical protein